MLLLRVEIQKCRKRGRNKTEKNKTKQNIDARKSKRKSFSCPKQNTCKSPPLTSTTNGVVKLLT